MSFLKAGIQFVYFRFGVCKVKRIEVKYVGGKNKDFAMCETAAGMNLLIPLDRAEQLGVRPIHTKEEIAATLAQVFDTPVKIDQTTWSRRYREYMEKLRSGSFSETAFVFHALQVLRETRDINFGERKMLDQAYSLLSEEMRAAGYTEDDVVATLLLGGNT